MKTFFISIFMMMTFIIDAQTFETDLPDDFASISLEFDLFGSLDKEGINTVLSVNRVDFEVVDWNIQLQTLFNGDGLEEGWTLTYLDLQAGVGVMFPISPRITFTPGIHGGVLLRPKNIVEHPSYTGFAGYMIYGVTSKGRWWLGKTKKLAITVSGAYDYAPDVEGKWGRINGRAGFEYIID